MNRANYDEAYRLYRTLHALRRDEADARQRGDTNEAHALYTQILNVQRHIDTLTTVDSDAVIRALICLQAARRPPRTNRLGIVQEHSARQRPRIRAGAVVERKSA
jgi:hypothetical protein